MSGCWLQVPQPARDRSRDIGRDGRFEGRRQDQDMTGGVLAFRCLGTAIPSGLEGSDLELGRALVRALGDPSSNLKEIRQPIAAESCAPG